MDFNLREKSSTLLNFIHTIDCLLVVAILWLLAKIFKVPWTDYYFNLAIGIIYFELRLFLFSQFVSAMAGH